jgi:hypothetical protein
MDLLRWFRFLWAAGIGWDQATRVEARDFCRWIQLAAKPAPGAPGTGGARVDVLTTASRASVVTGQARRIPGVWTAFTTAGSPPVAGTGLVEILPAAEPASPSGAATVVAVRHALADQPGVIGVGGQGASDADFTHAVCGSFPLMLSLIALVTLLLLARAFRSLVLAAKAVIFNLASVSAAYGVMVLVWQQGHGSHDQRGADPLPRLPRLVGHPETDIKVLATGFGAGILFDAVVIRSTLLPALIGVLGRWNWWLPAPAARILRAAPSAPVPEPASPGRQRATARRP